MTEVGPLATHGPATTVGPEAGVKPSIEATAQRDLLLSSHESGIDDAFPSDPHVDDGFRDQELPELRFGDLDDDDPRAALPPRPSTVPLPRIRWWVDAGGRVHFAVRPPIVAPSATTAKAMGRHVTTLEGVAALIAGDYPGAVRAASMWEGLQVTRPVTSTQLSNRLKNTAVVTDGSNLSRLSDTVVQFPWGLTTLGTLTKLSASGNTRPCVEEMLGLAAFLGDPDHPERLADDPSAGVRQVIERVRADQAQKWGSKADTLAKHQKSLLGILRRPARVWAARTLLPIGNWPAVASALGDGVPEYLAVMAVAGAFDPALEAVWTRTREAS